MVLVLEGDVGLAQDYYFSSHTPDNNNDDFDNDKNKSKNKKKAGPSPAAKRKAPAGKRSPARGVSAGAGKAPAPRRQEPTDKKGKALSIFLKVLIAAAIVCVFTGVVVGTTVLIYSINYVNGDTVLDLETEQFNTAQTTFIYGKDSNGKEVELVQLHGTENRVWEDLDEMSPYISKAFVALEDKRFYKHHGVDWFRTLSAIFVHGGKQGGSTITQQLIKNMTNQDQITFVRKFNEILTALNLEKSTDKEQILEAYLNSIYLSHGCYGVKTASEKYFGKDIKDLNIAECASLAAITQWPNRYDPLIKPEKNRERQLTCLENMKEQGLITEEEYNEAVNYKMVFTNSADYTGSTVKDDEEKKTESKIQSYYVDYVIDTVIADLKAKGYSQSNAKKMIYGGGLKIYSAIDMDVQNILEDVYVNYKKMPDHNVQSAMTIMEYDGRVAGIIGGTGEKTANRVLNRATSSPRQPGSTMKPLGVYAPALEVNAIYWSKLIKDAPSRSEKNPAVPGKDWPTNQGEQFSNSNVTVQKAIAKSLNTVPVRILTDIGFETSLNYVKDKFHISTVVAEGEKNDVAYSPLALGGMTKGATTLDMTAAYQVFGNGGYYNKPYCYYKVVNSKNEVILEHESDKEAVISEANATVMNKLLCSVVTDPNGTGKAYAINSKYEMFAKTGTTTGSNDRWFVAGTPYYVAAVWYGYDTPKEIVYKISANPCGTIWNLVMGEIHSKKKLDGATFETSSGAVKKSYCTSTGLLAGKNCGDTATGWYDAKKLPSYCSGKHSGDASSSSEKTTAKPSGDAKTTEGTTAASTTQGDKEPSAAAQTGD